MVEKNPTGTQDQTLDWVKNITNPTDYLSQFRHFCAHARSFGISEQQLLDNVNAGYSGDIGNTGNTGDSSRK